MEATKKMITMEERDELVDIFHNAVTGSGGTLRAGIDAMLSELGIEVEPKPVVEVT